MFNLFKKEKEINNVMYQRLKALHKKVKYLQKYRDYVKTERIEYIYSYGNEINVNTALGTRYFKIERYNECKYRLTMKSYVKPEGYSFFFSDNHYEEIFEVIATKDDLIVKPLLVEELSAKDIDLAILEFENIVNEGVAQVKEHEIKHKEEVQKLMKRNTSEV